MATFRKRGTSWRAEVWINGQRKSATFDTKAQAKHWAAETEVAMKDSAPVSTKYTLRDALARYVAEVTPQKKGARWEAIRINKMLRLMEFADTRLSDITPDDITRWRDAEQQRISGPSVRREMSILAAVMDVARREWGWIEESPLRDVRKPARSKPRDRRVTQDEIERIAATLCYQEQLPVTMLVQEVAIAFMLAIETGMRAGEIYGLEWQRVHLDRRIVRLDETKNGDARSVPLSTRAVELLRKLEGRNAVQVFTVSSASASTLFRKARDRAGIAGLHFHDSRHEAITRLSKKLGVLELARMVGHRDPRSLMTYYNESAEALALLLD